VPWGDADLVKAKPSNSSVTANHQKLEGCRVLVIDNEPAILQGMQAMMQQWGCKVYCAASSIEALSLVGTLAKSDEPNVILADYHLDQGLLGTDAIADIRLALHNEIPAIVITADRSQQMKQAVAEAGFGLIHKPLKPAVLRKLINRLL